jgi:hypothetical protein
MMSDIFKNDPLLLNMEDSCIVPLKKNLSISDISGDILSFNEGKEVNSGFVCDIVENALNVQDSENVFEVISGECYANQTFTDKWIVNKMDVKIDSYIISNDSILKAQAYIVQICCINLNYSTYKPTPSSGEQNALSFQVEEIPHCCPICLPFNSVSEIFVVNKLDDLQPFVNGLPINCRLPQSRLIFQAQMALPNEIRNVLVTLQQRMHLREVELVQGVIYFEQILKVFLKIISFFYM